MTDDSSHPEPADSPEFGDEEVQHVDYLLWTHGADSALRARVTAELRGETPPEWAVGDDDRDDGDVLEDLRDLERTIDEDREGDA